MSEIRNGEVWQAPWPVCFRGIVQYITDDRWMLLSTPSKAAHGGSCMMPHSDPDPPHQIFYTKTELTARLERFKWTRTDQFAQCDGWPVCRTSPEA